jgi:hydrogenase maturation protease
LPDGAEVADGGTSGMDVAFRMRGADRVILLDAARTGGRPGTLYRMLGTDVEQLPDLSTINLHSFRWDHALAFARWLLKDDYPTDVIVYLIEAESFEFGAPLSATVDEAAERLADRLLDELAGPFAGATVGDHEGGA